MKQKGRSLHRVDRGFPVMWRIINALYEELLPGLAGRDAEAGCCEVGRQRLQWPAHRAMRLDASATAKC